MLAFLGGRIIAVLSQQMILTLPSGVGYQIIVNPQERFLVNENLDLFIYEAIRENKVELYGFKELAEKEWMEKLMKVSGIGPKMAATIIYSLGLQKLSQAIFTGNSATLSEIKGLGQKTAKKIVLELKGATVDLEDLDNQISNSKNGSDMAIDFTDTLSSLGYKRPEIVSVITKLKKLGQWQEDNLMATVKKALELIGKK